MEKTAVKSLHGPIEDMALKDRIKTAMEDAGLTPAELARRTKYTEATVSHWLSGRTKTLKGASASKVAQATGYNEKWLIEGKGERKHSNKEPRGSATGETVDRKRYSDLAERLATLFDMLPDDPQLQARAFGACTQILFNLSQPLAEATPAQTASVTAKSPS